MPRCACASEVYGSVFVCVFVCVCVCVCVSVCLSRVLQLLRDMKCKYNVHVRVSETAKLQNHNQIVRYEVQVGMRRLCQHNFENNR